MTAHVSVEGWSVWGDGLPDRDKAESVLRGRARCDLSTPSTRPVASMLSSAERRRAPDTVAAALHVAHEAVLASGRDAASLRSVFASALGEIATTDYLCDTLARDPSSLSPTRFIHSVHNTVAGFWGIACGCHRPSLAMAAGVHTVGMALTEAAAQAVATREAVLMVAYDMQPVGLTQQLTNHTGAEASRARLALAMILAPRDMPHDASRVHHGIPLTLEVRSDAGAMNEATIDAPTTDSYDDAQDHWPHALQGSRALLASLVLRQPARLPLGATSTLVVTAWGVPV